VDFEDFTPIKTFISMCWLDDKQGRLVVATSGSGGGVRAWVGVWREKNEKLCFSR